MRIILLTLHIYEWLMQQATTTGMIKIIWVDEHGPNVWDNADKEDTLECLSLALENYLSLPEIVTFWLCGARWSLDSEGFKTQEFSLMLDYVL